MPVQSALFVLYVADQRRSARFYSQVLGVEPTLDVPGMTELTLGAGCRLGLMPEQGIVKLLPALPDPARARVAPRCEVYLLVDDPAACHARALAQGAVELSPLARREWGDLAAYCLDPDGHVLVFARAAGPEDGPMSDPAETNADQLAFWNGPGGRVWVERQAHTDASLARVFQALLELAAPRPGERVLDVGCGCGALTLELARAVGPTGRVQALDISGPMLAQARARAQAAGIANVTWGEQDAASAALEGYDLLVSSFGLMFFGDPVAAFAHLRRAARPGARLAFVCWRSLPENPWLAVPMRAIAPHLPEQPPENPQGPGMFRFADPERIARILTEAGWAPPTIAPLELELDVAAGRGLDEAVVQTTRIGLVSSWLSGEPEEVVAAATASIRAAFEPHVAGPSVRLPAAMWLVTSAPG